MTGEELRRVLAYNPATGVLTWLDCPAGANGAQRMKAGRPAGCISTFGYVVVRLNKVLYPAQRLIWLWMTGVWPPEQVDHRNEIKSDNRWQNLRLATHGQNQTNRKASTPNTTGYRGVIRFRGGFLAQIRVNGKLKAFYPVCATAEEAYARYCAAAREHHGSFARLD
jgi:hypothetical protein